MVKIQSTALFLVFSMLLVAPEVHGTAHIGPRDINVFGSSEGLLARTIRSQKPTNNPTDKATGPTEPTSEPTESPAPSPSPSENPTITPGRVTSAPSEAPTESPAPSPAPSMTPTSAPSPSPTATPTAAPTVSAAPSYSPSESPSKGPTASPSASPSDAPTTSAAPSSSPTLSMAPSAGPTDSPSGSPSEFPSDAPSMSPTSVTDRTKTAIATLLLEDIVTEMDRLILAEFELFTLEFLRKKIPKNDSYDLNTLAATVLSQKNVRNPDLPAAPKAEEPPSRKLETEDWIVGLEIDLRTVSVVTDGRVPKDFNFTEVVLLTFYNHWDQYLWQLGNSVEFFNPLIDVSDWQPILIEDAVQKKGKASFVVAVMFSFIAFLLAVFASYVAIRKHMNKRSNGRTPSKKHLTRGSLFSPNKSPKHYDVMNYLTRTMTDDKGSPASYHDGDVEGGGALGLVRNVNIDINEDGLESVVLTPRANFRSPNASVRNGLFVVDEVSDDDQSPLKSPEATSPMVDPTSASRIGGQIKKWLTPRGLGVSSSNRRLSSDPPENESMFGYNYGMDHIEPVAVKASTKNHTGIYTTDKSTIDGRSKVSGISYNKKPSDEGQFTLPVSFFSNRGPGNNASGVDSPMSSLADSNASSFFAIGNMNKSFTGQKNTIGAMEDEGLAARPRMNLDPTPRNETPVKEVAVEDFVEDEPIASNENQPVEQARPKYAQNPTPSESSAKARSVKLAAQRFEIKQQQPLREVQPPSSTIGVEAILGARSRDSQDNDDKRSNVSSSSFLKNRSIFSPNKNTDDVQPKKRPPSTRYGRVNIEVQEQETRSVTSHSTLGARPLQRNEDNDDRSTISALSTLSSIMRRPGSYDVYAPSGPIGIVVDTSKDGPSVHSLKSTSPMLGLISPGDLIVALDGEDTRKMTAAALTRLMARKSRQKERKITLLS
eukprot:CAMPEP_0116137634 /NCGR_PEP_ID=MMETSP0329-20121206/12347_1 /TAXON_ID=697910 /ORGANISM="Pseudo-nitzschia arenysensis, Strain B593" /LENGTH=937 /DNA_ID=CAMNT_0003632551 /DNA_START=102 /DNA_END=2915 /DNA_ORIENTATION=-